MKIKDEIIRKTGLTTAAIGYLVGTGFIFDARWGSKDLSSITNALVSYAISIGGAFVASKIEEKKNTKSR